MKETITTVTYSISGIPSVCLHFEGEIRKSELPVSLQREFGFTNLNINYSSFNYLVISTC